MHLEHVKLFVMKFIITFVILFLILGGGFKISFGDVFLISFVLSLVGYATGDRIVLDRAKNITTTLFDLVFIFIFIYFMTGAISTSLDVFTASILSTVSLAIFEYFFHQSVVRTLESDDDPEGEASVPNGNLRTEASQELTPYKNKDRN